MHRVLGTGISASIASKSGACAIAVAQLIGFGILSGALVRLRMLPGYSFLSALRLSFAVSATFIASMGIICVVALLLLPNSVGIPAFVPFLLLFLIICLVAAILLMPQAFAKLPALWAIGTFTGLVTLDLGCAAIALMVFLPFGVPADISHFVVVYLLAFSAGLISGAPTGMGAFELTMVSLLPDIPAEQLIAAILAYRVVYFVLPGLCAFFCMIAPKQSDALLKNSCQSIPSAADIERALWTAPRAETNLYRQGAFDAELTKGGQLLLSATHGQSHISLSPPVFNSLEAIKVLTRLKAQGHTKMRVPFGYKCSARLAAAARRAGWKAVPVVQEAWIKPCQFSLQSQGLGQLRRHLKKALKSGVTVLESDKSDVVLLEMEQVAKDWAEKHGGERRFSMGRYEQDYVAHQRVFLAYSKGVLVGFISFHETVNEWALDLMRSRPNAPNGAMHLLISLAIEKAASEGISKMSLASAPLQHVDPRGVFGKVYQIFTSRFCGGGLHRFKNAFAPKWTTVYAIAPSKLGLTMGLYDVMMAIRPQKTSQKRHNS